MGFFPEYWLDDETYVIGRVWYLKAAPMFEWYFIFMLFQHPFETLVFWLVGLIIFKCRENKQILQKDLNKVWVGPELDYSHKIGRILGHAFIVFYHGPGIPLLYLLFFAQIGIFILIEKALMLRIYKRFEHIEAYIRQYIIHVILLMLVFHYFRAIDVFGAEEIFPFSYSETLGIKSGTLLYYYEPDEMAYAEKIILPQGIGYFLLAIFTAIFYAIIWWTHRRIFLSKIFGWCALLTKFSFNAIPLTTVRNRTLGFFPDTYKFEKTLKYREALPTVEARITGRQEVQDRIGSPEKSHLDSHYDINSEANSGDDAIAKKNELIGKPVYNIYRGPDLNSDNQHQRINSDDIDEEVLDH